MSADVIDLAARRKRADTDKAHLLRYADDFERAAAGHPEIKTRLALRLAALLRALAAEQEGGGA